ncbi:MAG: SRPBCC family protein [Mucilaginibacter polytrichastri]|nr:SRPBCC family protein [Mucilaginibacter polytrichastri]
MLIRRPAADVFNAFIDPEITTNFWFSKSSGKLEEGKMITWTWEWYNVHADVQVTAIVEKEKIAFDWNGRHVMFSFRSLSDGSTYVTAREDGYTETGDDLLAAIRDSTGGFTTVLDGLKAWLEQGINLGLIPDKFPKEAIAHGK